ncbi:MAG: hypothetical protein HRT94_05075 [Alphaproteobacteria bacterium]|nr:hypothetical protein [Alphaproteobacteria bacterium]
MMYSRLNIPTLNIDLAELPISKGSCNLYAQTTDGSHIGIRLSGQWLEVRTSPQNGTKEYYEMEDVIIS